MTFREFFQTTVANLRTFFVSLGPAKPAPPMIENQHSPATTMASTEQPEPPDSSDHPAERTLDAPMVEPDTSQQPSSGQSIFEQSLPIQDADIEETSSSLVEGNGAEDVQGDEGEKTGEEVTLIEDAVIDEIADEVSVDEDTVAADPPVAEYPVEEAREEDAIDEPHPSEPDLPPQTPSTPTRPLSLTALLESLLFVAGEPMPAAQFAQVLERPAYEIEAELARLAAGYVEDGRGIRLQLHKEQYQLVTAPAAAAYVETFLNLDLDTRLSGPALEALAIIAYRQPVTRAQIEAVRGVDCAGVLRSLVQRGLIEEVARLEAVGRPILYGVTDLFMQCFGLTGLDELPPLAQESEDTLWAATELAEEATEEQVEEQIPEQTS